MLKTGSAYDESTFEIVRQKQTERRKYSLIVEAKKLWLQLLEPPKIA
jgi:hypothetical protein